MNPPSPGPQPDALLLSYGLASCCYASHCQCRCSSLPHISKRTAGLFGAGAATTSLGSSRAAWARWSSSSGFSSSNWDPLVGGGAAGWQQKSPGRFLAGALRVGIKSRWLLRRASGHVLDARMGSDGRSRDRHRSRMGHLNEAHGRLCVMTEFDLLIVPRRAFN